MGRWAKASRLSGCQSRPPLTPPPPPPPPLTDREDGARPGDAALRGVGGRGRRTKYAGNHTGQDNKGVKTAEGRRDLATLRVWTRVNQGLGKKTEWNYRLTLAFLRHRRQRSRLCPCWSATGAER